MWLSVREHVQCAATVALFDNENIAIAVVLSSTGRKEKEGDNPRTVDDPIIISY